MRRVSFIVLALSVVLAGTVVVERPASASIASVSLTTPQSMGLTCPATIQVAGGIVGTAGQAITYRVQTNFNGVATVILGPKTTTLPASGSLNASFPVTVPVLTGTNNNLQVVVTAGPGLPVVQTLQLSCSGPAGVSLTTPDSDHLTCPNIVNVTAAFTGSAGTTYQYQALMGQGGNPGTYINGTGANAGQSGTGQFVMPASGTMAVSFPVPIQQLAAGSFVSMQVLAANAPANQQRTAKLALACGPDVLTDFKVYLTPAGGAWRPKDDIHYAYENLKVALRVLQPSPPNPKVAFTVGSCGYHASLVNREGTDVADGAPLGSPRIETEGGKSYYVNDVDIGYPRDSGVYHLVATPKEIDAHDGTTTCTGKVDQQIVIYPQTAWIVGFRLQGNGYHIGMASDSPVGPTWCSSCDSIFSPAHNTALLSFAPDVKGATYFPPGKGTPYQDACAYDVDFYGSKFSGNNNWNLKSHPEMLYKNGQSFPNSPDTQNPYVSQWDGDSNTVQVVIKEANDSTNPVLNCNILGGQLSGSITFTDQNGFKRGNQIGQ